MREVVLLRFGEIFLKGKNHRFFEKTLLNNIRVVAKKYNATITEYMGSVLLYTLHKRYYDKKQY